MAQNNSLYDNLFDEIKKLQDDPSIPQSVSNRMVLSALIAMRREVGQFKSSVDDAIATLSDKVAESTRLLTKRQEELESRITKIEASEEVEKKIYEVKEKSTITVMDIMDKLVQPTVMIIIAALVSYIVSNAIK